MTPLLRYPTSGWAASTFSELSPGAHLAVYGWFRTAMEAEDAGFEVRDSITVVGPRRHQVWLFRKPIEESSIIAQVLKTGTGAINIDGCRIGYQSEEDQMKAFPGGTTTSGKTVGMPSVESSGGRKPFDPIQSVKGRWPANVVLVHAGCVLGVLTSTPVWQCTRACPVRKLDEQSGDRPSTLTGRADGPQENPAKARPEALWGQGMKGGVGQVYADSGGASRFFSQFADENELDVWLLKLLQGDRHGESNV